MRETIRALLAADGQLAAVLVGGVHAGGQIDRKRTPAAFDANQEIQPCALVRLENHGHFGPYRHSARQFVMIYLYQRTGYEVIDAALERIYQLLDGQKIGEHTWEVSLADQQSDLEDPALDCSLGYCRYVVTHNRVGA